MLIRSFKINKKIFISTIIIILVIILSIVVFYSFANDEIDSNETSSEKDYIKWVDFNVTAEAMKLTSKLDIESHNNNAEVKYNWIELLAYLATQNGGNFKNFKKSDLDNLAAKLDSGEQMSDLTSSMKFYDYYYEAYSAVLSGFIGNLIAGSNITLRDCSPATNVELLNDSTSEPSDYVPASEYYGFSESGTPKIENTTTEP